MIEHRPLLLGNRGPQDITRVCLVCGRISDLKPFCIVVARLVGCGTVAGVAVLGRAVVPRGGCASDVACSLPICLDPYLSLLFVTGGRGGGLSCIPDDYLPRSFE